MKFHQSFFGKRPGSFDTIDVDFPIDEAFTMIDSQMTESAWDETIITSKFIGINETSTFHLFEGNGKESFTRDILNNLNPDYPYAFQDIEHRDLTRSSPISVPFLLPLK